MNHFKPIWFHRYVIVVPLLVVLGACAPVLTSNTTTPPAPSTTVLDTPAPVATPSPTTKVEKGNSADEPDEPSADRHLVSYRGTNPHYESSPPFEIVYSPAFWEYMPGDGPGRVAQLVNRDMAGCSLSLGGGGMEALPVSILNLAGTEWTVFQVQPQHLQYLSRWDDSFFLFSLALPEAYADNPEGPCRQAVQDVLMTFKIEGEPPPALPNDDKDPLVVREWPITPASVIGPGRLEYNDVLGEEILSQISALRDQSAEHSLALANEALVPFGYRLDSRFDAAFGFARIGEQPFYFFEKDGLIQISYGGQVLPNAYKQVFHNHCCEAAIHNVGFGPDAVWFHALREGIWYFVEAGTRASSEMADRVDEELALRSLVDFFEHLSARRYDAASQLYGGSYEVLIDNNPTLDPQDHAALLGNACTANGFQCLRVRSARLQDQVISRAEFRFVVEFCTPDGGLFVRGPCCGASKTEMPSQSEFLFAVVQSENGAFRVQDPPVYVP
jgi:hypothetical protein